MIEALQFFEGIQNPAYKLTNQIKGLCPGTDLNFFISILALL